MSDFTDSDSLFVSETTVNDAYPDGANSGRDQFTVTEQTLLVIHDGIWEACPPYGVGLVQGSTTVASCGGGGYEQPTTEMFVSAPVTITQDLPYWEFTLYDAAGNPLDLSLYDEIRLDVATTAGQYVWTVDCEVLDEVGALQTQLFGGVTYVTRTVTDGVTANTDATVTSATAAFTAADVGSVISGAGITAGTTIASINSATSIEMSAPATATATGVTLTIGDYAAAAGDYYARFTLDIGGAIRSVPTVPILIHVLEPAH